MGFSRVRCMKTLMLHCKKDKNKQLLFSQKITMCITGSSDLWGGLTYWIRGLAPLILYTLIQSVILKITNSEITNSLVHRVHFLISNITI